MLGFHLLQWLVDLPLWEACSPPQEPTCRGCPFLAPQLLSTEPGAYLDTKNLIKHTHKPSELPSPILMGTLGISGDGAQQVCQQNLSGLRYVAWTLLIRQVEAAWYP